MAEIARWKAVTLSVVHLVIAFCSYQHLVSGGWLQVQYHVNDPNVVNLLLALFEAVVIISVGAYWTSRSQALYRLLRLLMLIQALVLIGVLVFVALFALTWHPRLM